MNDMTSFGSSNLKMTLTSTSGVTPLDLERIDHNGQEMNNHLITWQMATQRFDQTTPGINAERCMEVLKQHMLPSRQPLLSEGLHLLAI